MLPILLGLLLGVLAAVVVAMCVGDYRLVALLRRDHHATWEGLGSPSPWFSRFEDLRGMHRFLFQKQDQVLQDPTVHALSRRLRILHRLAYALGAALLLLAFAAKLIRRA